MSHDEATPSGAPAASRRGRVAVVLAVVVAAAVGLGLVLAHRSTPGSPSTSTPTTSRAVVAPLTGLLDRSGATARRCAVTVKVGNTRDARPQYGVEQADVVYEEVVEGGITRLAAVFQSQAPARVGSVRSVRFTDQSLVWPIKGVFAFSGGTAHEVASIETAPVTRLDETAAGALMFRDPARRAPHNLFARVDRMYGRCADPPPRPLFGYRPAGSRASGAPVSSARIGFAAGYAVTWTWDAASGAWRRSIFDAPDVTASGARLSVANVVIMPVRYLNGAGADRSEAVLTGSGPVSVLTDGKVVEGTWVRPDKAGPARLLDRQGHPIRLTPGRTWVELPDLGYAVTTSP